jgi:hypothetical protein
MRISQLPLNDLYERKITASVETAIHQKEDFTKVNPTYCEKVCRMQCKNYRDVSLLSVPADILVIQDHMAPDGKWDRRDGQQEALMQSLIGFLGNQSEFQGLTVRKTTLLKCKPNELDFPRGKSPSSTTLMKCRPYLWSEIAASKPKVIISLSTAVTKALGLKNHSNTGNRGEIVQSAYGPVLLTIHPRVLTMIRQNASGAFWSSDYMGVIKRDFLKAAMVARGTLVPRGLLESVELAKKNITVASSMEEVTAMLTEIQNLPEQQLISFDTETTGLDGLADEAKLLCIQFGWRDPKTGVIVAGVIPLWHRKNVFYDPQEAWNLVIPLLVGPRGKIAHNGKFDILYIYHTTGVRVRNLKFDTMLVLHSLDSGTQGCYGLKTAVTDYLPMTGLSGYETLLPKLTRRKPVEDEDQSLEEELTNEDGYI